MEEDFDLDNEMAQTLETVFIAVSDDEEEAEELMKNGAEHVILEDKAVEKIILPSVKTKSVAPDICPAAKKPKTTTMNIS
ncbi:hypothetical protein HRED_08688 [Candidatus Haloredivivus sp. G17]|nr:hypothetical protein HRED_08688 [Candidatus Haloredivivus sp. G17]